MSKVITTADRLRPNADWAKLPLFSRKGWARVRFGDMVENVNERVEPADAAEEIYVGLDDLNTGCLHIRRWGKGSDVIGTKLRFRKGDVIFGRRRAYQRKLAVAEVDGICSAHAMVVRAKPERVLPVFLPFLMMSDRFMARAVEISVGSLSPTINWTTLKLEEFDLPPRDQQQRLAEMLWTIDDVTESYLNAARACAEWVGAFSEHRCLDGRFRRVRLEVILKAIIAGKSVVGVNEPACDGERGVLKVSAVGPRGFDPAENKRLLNRSEFVPTLSVKAGDFLITRCNTKELVGRVCIAPKDHPSLMLCDKTLKLDFDEQAIAPAYMEAVLKSREVRAQIEAFASGTGGAMKNISQDHIRSLLVPLPELAAQQALVKELQQGLESHARLEAAAESAASLQFAITNELMGIRV